MNLNAPKRPEIGSSPPRAAAFLVPMILGAALAAASVFEVSAGQGAVPQPVSATANSVTFQFDLATDQEVRVTLAPD